MRILARKYTKIIGKKHTYKVIWLEKVDSTSAELRRRLKEIDSFTVISASSQTEGRGQGDHKWHSECGKNLTFSLLVKYTPDRVFPALDQQLLTMATSLAVCDCLECAGIRANIKKPNDIYVKGNKICGMLIENGIHASLMDWSILGIGLDVNQTVFPADIPNPTSMCLETGKTYDTKKCLNEFLKHFSIRFDSIWDNPSSLKQEYESRLLNFSHQLDGSRRIIGLEDA